MSFALPVDRSTLASKGPSSLKGKEPVIDIRWDTKGQKKKGTRCCTYCKMNNRYVEVDREVLLCRGWVIERRYSVEVDSRISVDITILWVWVFLDFVDLSRISQNSFISTLKAYVGVKSDPTLHHIATITTQNPQEDLYWVVFHKTILLINIMTDEKKKLSPQLIVDQYLLMLNLHGLFSFLFDAHFIAFAESPCMTKFPL